MHILLLLCLLSPCILYSQDSTTQYESHAPYSFGIIAGSSSIHNKAIVPVIPNSLSCGIYDNGNSAGLLLGLFGEYSLIPAFASISGRAYYAQHPGNLQSEECKYIVYNDQTKNYDSLRMLNQYSVSLDRIMLDLGLSIYPIPDIPFFIRAAGSMGFGISQNTFERSQKLESPSSVSFPGGSKTRVIDRGDIVGSMHIAANASLGYFVHLTPAFALMPEIAYSQSFTSLVANDDWKYQSLDFRVGLSYRPLIEKQKDMPLPPEPEPIIVEDIPPPPAQTVNNPIRFASINAPDLELQQTIITQTFPILPYIFFDSLSTKPNSISIVPNPNFKENQVSSNTLETYNNLLEIIAKRMNANSDSKITLIGSTDGKEKKNSGDRKALALQRAESIKDILVDSWNIDPGRINVQSRDLPKVLSNKEYREGDAENRRVEIESDSPEILSPVVYSTFNEYVPLQNKVSCKIDLDTAARIHDWTFQISHGGRVLHSNAGIGNPSSTIDIPLDSAIISSLGNQIASHQDSVDIQISFRDDAGNALSSQTKQAIKNTQNTFEISRLSLIVFEYDESRLSDKNARMMKEFLKKEIGPESRIEITGSTDRLGEVDYNIELSQERAKAVESFMNSVQKNLNIISVKGIGSSRMLFDNALPEGRYYCRTVSIEVKNPIQSLPGK